MRVGLSSARNLWHSRSRGLPLPGLPPALSEDRESGAQNPFARRHSARGAAECRHQSMPPREETRSDRGPQDRKSTRLNSSHGYISYAVFCLKKKINLSGVSTLNLDADTLAGMFLGHINKWNDPKIAALNAGVSYLNKNITLAHRSDGSCTTYILTDYLSKVSDEWKTKAGNSKSVSWPA